jgi:hypothetical protein
VGVGKIRHLSKGTVQIRVKIHAKPELAKLQRAAICGRNVPTD